jgi:hypothetical protein
VQQLTWRIASWAALLLHGSLLSWGAQQKESEAEVLIKAAVDQHYALMPQDWRADFARRLASRVDSPGVAGPTRALILRECNRVVEGGTAPMMLIQQAAEFFPSAAPTEETLAEGSRISALSIESIFKNAVLYAPLSDAERQARQSDLKAFEQQAMRIVDERIVGDDRSRNLVSSRIASLFKDYEAGIGDPTRPFLNRPLAAGTLGSIVEDLEKSFPREKKYVVTGLTGDRDADARMLQEQGVDDLIFDVVANRIYTPLVRASWADQNALKEGMLASERLWQWRDKVRESIRAKAVEQKIDLDRLRALLNPPHEIPRPVMKKTETPATGAAPSGQEGPQAGKGPLAVTPSFPRASRWPVWASAVVVLAVLLFLLLRRKPSLRA